MARTTDLLFPKILQITENSRTSFFHKPLPWSFAGWMTAGYTGCFVMETSDLRTWYPFANCHKARKTLVSLYPIDTHFCKLSRLQPNTIIFDKSNQRSLKSQEIQRKRALPKTAHYCVWCNCFFTYYLLYLCLVRHLIARVD